MQMIETEMKTSGIKERLIKFCKEHLNEKIRAIDQELEFIQASANEETKSSAGDKYETGREMMMLEKNKLLGQREQLLKQFKPLNTINITKTFTEVELGALVQVSNNHYFISSGIGPINLSGDAFMVVSAMAPIVQAMLGKQEGDSFSFNGNRSQITSIQ